jgi:hypothetical protein
MRTGQSRYGDGQILSVPAVRKDGARISVEFTIVEGDGFELAVPRHDELGASGCARNADQSRGREAQDGEPGVTSSGRVISAYRGRRRRFGNQTTGHRGTSLRPARIV